MSQREAWCDRKINGVSVKEADPASWHKELCRDCMDKGICARWDWENCLESERREAREVLAKRPWMKPTYENLWMMAFNLHLRRRPAIRYTDKQIMEQRDKAAEDAAEVKELYNLGEICSPNEDRRY